jgi:hypothetical protein
VGGYMQVYQGWAWVSNISLTAPTTVVCAPIFQACSGSLLDRQLLLELPAADF